MDGRPYSLSGAGAVAVALLLVGQVLLVPVQRRQLVREAELHVLHEPGEASPLQGPASLQRQVQDTDGWTQITAASVNANDR